MQVVLKGEKKERFLQQSVYGVRVILHWRAGPRSRTPKVSAGGPSTVGQGVKRDVRRKYALYNSSPAAHDDRYNITELAACLITLIEVVPADLT